MLARQEVPFTANNQIGRRIWESVTTHADTAEAEGRLSNVRTMQLARDTHN